MNYIFLLSGDYIDLGAEEILSLLYIKNYKLKNRLLILELNDKKSIDKISKRLALTKNIYEFLFKCKIDDLVNNMKNFDWNSVYNDNFCLRKYNLDNDGISVKNPINKKNNKKLINKIIGYNNKKLSEKNLAGYLWRSIKNPKVNLVNPKTEINLFFFNGRVYCGLLIKKIGYDFDSRKSHMRPFPHPSSLHPKVARALVNLSEIEENEILLDPFCGTGGFLIEAGMMNIKSIGYDINKIMIKGCTQNLEYYKIKNYKIKTKNALNIDEKFDSLVTDLPYGLNSTAMTDFDEENWKKYRLNLKIQKKDFYENLEKFYLSFLKNLRKKLKKKAVIVFPSYVDYRKLLKLSKFEIEKEFSDYVHRSLTRKIVKIK
ncbi:MAG TPA: DNA methyltransferase [Candidatus Nanoarchaeia archaeon]|nr:DNA methyltransferase [Candidatus Nanoarchaeia archaeon]